MPEQRCCVGSDAGLHNGAFSEGRARGGLGLYRSTVGISMTADGKFIDITLSQAFNTYGLFVDYGTGRNTPRGNSGGIGRANPHKRKRWFSHKYYASVMSIQEFFADNLSHEFCRAVSHSFSPSFGRFCLSKESRHHAPCRHSLTSVTTSWII